MNIKIKLLRGTAAPVYATDGAAAADIHACLDEPVTIGPGCRYAVPSGFAIEIPRGYAGIISGRSGSAKKFGVSLANGIGIIDSDFRGEVHVLLINSGKEPYTVQNGDRIAQIMFIRCETAVFCECAELSHTARGDGGFGSTGVK